MTAYRDDLEAAQLRASDLEREMKELRARSTELERLRIETARRHPEAQQPQQPPTRTLNNGHIMLIASWIASVAFAAICSAPRAALFVSVIFLVIMALAPPSSSGSEDRE